MLHRHDHELLCNIIAFRNHRHGTVQRQFRQWAIEDLITPQVDRTGSAAVEMETIQREGMKTAVPDAALTAILVGTAQYVTIKGKKSVLSKS